MTKLPLSYLKIAGNFVRDMEVSKDSTLIVTAIIMLGKNLGLKVVAEGVETETQFNFLKSHGCQEMQGHFFSGPVEAQEMEKLLEKGYISRLDAD